MLVKSAFDTFPLVIHVPDCERNVYWPELKRLFLHGHPVEHSLDLSILTWNNLEEGCFEKSLRSRNIPFVVKGSDVENWLHYKKFEYNLEVAYSCGTKYLMGCDSHDVILMGSTAEIVRRFKEMDCKLLFNCEKNFYPDFPEPVLQGWKRYEESVARSHYKFLNAGAWIGETEYCIEFFRRANEVRVYDLFDCESYEFLRESSIGCDQSSLHHVFPEFPDVSLDYGCEIFLNISLPVEDEISIQTLML